jgi:transposase-like protein
MKSFICPVCKASDIVMRGKRYNKSGAKQLYRCNECRSTFVEPDGFERMRHKKEIIVRAIHQHQDGLSLSKVKNHLWQHDNVKVTKWTISMWTKKYSIFLKSASSSRKAKT